MSSLKRKMDTLHEAIDAKAAELAAAEATVDYTVQIEALDPDTNEQPHGASPLEISLRAPLAGKHDLDSRLQLEPKMRRYFARQAGYKFVAHISANLDTCTDGQHVSKLYFSGAADVKSTNANKSRQLLKVHDPDPNAVPWFVTLRWSDAKPYLVESIGFEHDPAEHPRFTALMEREARELTRDRAERLAGLALRVPHDDFAVQCPPSALRRVDVGVNRPGHESTVVPFGAGK